MLALILSFSVFVGVLIITRFYLRPGVVPKIILSVLYFIFLLITFVYIGANYFTGSGINESVLYTLSSNLTGAGINKYILPFGALLVVFLILLAVVWNVSGFSLKKNKKTTLAAQVLLGITLLISFVSNPGAQGIYSIIYSRVSGGEADFYTYYVSPDKNTEHPKKNIIYIYGESLERTYFNNKAFPNLTDDLSKIKDQSLDFDNTIQLPGTDYTIAGIVASQCGIPLFAPFQGNSSGSLSSFFPGTTCLGDILKHSGYDLYFYQGADLEFGGKDLFFKNHGFDHVYGKQQLASEVKDPKNFNDWGLYDDTLLDIAFKKYEDLAKQDKPFGLFLLTVDTHHPTGFIASTCKKKDYKYDGSINSSMSAVYCSQDEVANFIEKVKASPYFKNTIIVVTSDHLAMNNTAYDALEKQKRRDLFMVVDDGQSKQGINFHKERSSLDNGATVLDLMGGGNKIGLGRSSLSKDSLFKPFPDLISKVNSWKEAIIRLWGFPKEIKEFTVNKAEQKIYFSGSSFRLPVLFSFDKDSVEPHLAVYNADPLSVQLADFGRLGRFFWVDDCQNVEFAFGVPITHGLCMANGSLGGNVKVVQIKDDIFKSTLTFTDPTNSLTSYSDRVAALLTPADKIRYPGNTVDFTYSSLPVFVDSISGLSHAEDWGTWTDATISKSVTITTLKPLPEAVHLVIDAQAYKDGDGGIATVQIGTQTKQVSFSSSGNSQTLDFSNPEGANKIIITPLHPSSPLSHGESGDSRLLGLGLKKLTVN